MKSKRKQGLLKFYCVERKVHWGEGKGDYIGFQMLALVTERGNLVSEVEAFDGDPWYLKKCEGWQWDAFLVYCAAKGFTVDNALV